MTLRARGLCLLLSLSLVWGSSEAQPAKADALREQFAALQAKAVGRIGDRPVYLQSSETSGRMQGDVHALLDQPYELLHHEFEQAQAWCGILFLHLNVKYCRASREGQPVQVIAGLGRKFDQALPDVYWLRFDLKVADATEGYLDIALQAPTGPLGTSNYRIVVQAEPYAAGRSLLHMSYSYDYGVAARWAMQAYLGTLGRDKVGFTLTGRSADGQPIAVGGVRGVLERNTMRYYLAIEAYLGAAGLPPAQRLQRSLEDWFSASERYPQQLHEIDREAYLEMKRREASRQESVNPPGSGD